MGRKATVNSPFNFGSRSSRFPQPHPRLPAGLHAPTCLRCESCVLSRQDCRVVAVPGPAKVKSRWPPELSEVLTRLVSPRTRSEDPPEHQTQQTPACWTRAWRNSLGEGEPVCGGLGSPLCQGGGGLLTDSGRRERQSDKMFTHLINVLLVPLL